MSFKEVKELRKAHKLEDAIKMAEAALEQEPNEIWNKRAAAWVYYDYLKMYAQPDTYELFKGNLEKINGLQLPEDENMIFDNCGWQIGSLVFSFQKSKHSDFDKINELFDLVKNFHFTKPSKSYSFIYKAFHKGYQNWSKYLDFAEWWNFKNFLPEDYLEEEFNGKRMMAIAEQAFIAFSKKLLEGEINSPFQLAKKKINKERVLNFLPHLDQLIEMYPKYQYPPYFKAKLLLAIGDGDDVLTAFLPFAKQKRNDFWVWEVMAEIFSNDEELKFACYCKALSLRTPEDFLVKLRQAFAGILVEKNMLQEARTEIEKVVASRTEQGWKLPHQVQQWMGSEWYKKGESKPNNHELYSKHLRKAEEILFQNIPEEIIVVEFVNTNKNMLNFVKDKAKHGYFNYSGQLKTPEVGDVLKVRFNGEGQDGFFKILSARKTNSETSTSAIKEFQGPLRLIAPQNFAFVDDVFIDSKLAEGKALINSQEVSGRAILSYNKKKSEWGWKAIEVK